MLVFFRCVAEAVAEKGVRGLAGMVPGGPYACDMAGAVWKKYRERRRDEQIRQDVQQVAQAAFDEVKRIAGDVTREVAADATREDRAALELYLSQVPGAVRQSLKRPADANGKTVPPAFALASADDVMNLLPGRMPQFKPGDALAGKPGWSLVELLGVGGFGEVWLARHATMTALRGAVEFCHLSHARALRHESRVINRVMDVARGKPPNIVPLIDVHLDGEAPWLMYEYVAGGELTDMIRGSAGVAPELRVRRATFALTQLSSAVAYFHSLHPPIVHRDLKPSNVLIDSASKQLLVTDFGIGAVAAKSAIEEDRVGTTAAGRLASYMRGSHTPLYSSPQQRNGADPDPRDDVHALGVIAFQLLTGDLTKEPRSDFRDQLRDVQVPDSLTDLIGACVADNPSRRPADAADLLRRVRALTAAPPLPPPNPKPRVSDLPRAVPPAPLPPTLPRPKPTPFHVDAPRFARSESRAGVVALGSYDYDRGRFSPTAPPKPAPVPDDISDSKTTANVLAVVIGIGVFSLFMGVAHRAFFYIGVLVVIGFGTALVAVRGGSPYGQELARRRKTHAGAKRRLDALEDDWSRVCGNYAQRHAGLRRRVAELLARGRGLQSAFANELGQLAKHAERLAREQHMRQHVIVTSDIPGIGASRKQALTTHGILTALDVDAKRVTGIDGFGPGLTSSLLAWRDAVARQFQFDPAAGVGEANLSPLVSKYNELQASVLDDLERCVVELEGLGDATGRQLGELVRPLQDAVAALDQADADLDELLAHR